jgi:chromosome segregation ATPase
MEQAFTHPVPLSSLIFYVVFGIRDYFPTQSSNALSHSGAGSVMSSRPRRLHMRPSREFNVVLHARDQQVSTLHDHNESLKSQLESSQRRLTNARANAHADARAYQLQERKIEQLRIKLRDVRAGSVAQRRELEDVKRESEMLRVQLAEAQDENLRHLARIAKLEESLQARSAGDVEQLGVSHDDVLDALARVTVDLEVMARISESLEQPHKPGPLSAQPAKVEIGIQHISDEHVEANQAQSRNPHDGVDMESLVSQLRAASERDQQRIRDLEVDVEHGRRLNEELRIATDEERRLVQDSKASLVQAQSRMASLEDAAREDQQTIKAFEVTVAKHRSEIDSLDAQVILLRTLSEESRAFNDDLEESHNAVMRCKDAFIQDLQERVKHFAASETWNQQQEAAFDDARERLAAADIEILELRLELESARQNAVASTNRIIQLETEASAARHRLRTSDAENGDLREALGMATERMYALEDELLAAQGRLDNAENGIRQLRQKLEQYVRTHSSLPNAPRLRNDIHDVNDTDSVSDEGSIDTLVMDFEEHHLPRLPSDDDSPSATDHDKTLVHQFIPVSVHSLSHHPEAMTIKCKVAEATHICGDDVEDILRTTLPVNSEDNRSLELSPVPDAVDIVADNPLPTIPEEDEPAISSTPQCVPRPRVQTRFAVVPPLRRGNGAACETVALSTESPLLPSPTLSDIWFSSARVSLALAEETGGSVLDWDLPSSGGDSDSS